MSAIFKDLFKIPLSRGGACRTMQRVARKAEGEYEKCVDSVRGSPRVRVDETGWRVEGVRNWAHVLVGDQATCYRIRPSRGAEVAAEILGWDYSGTLLHDGFTAYEQFEKATHAQCVQHALRRAHLLVEAAPTRGIAQFSQGVIETFKSALAERTRFNIRGCKFNSPARQRAYDEHTEALASLIVNPKKDAANERFAKHLRRNLFAWFQSLLDPLLEAANWPAEQGVRPLVVNRKVWGGNRTWIGAHHQEIHSSILETCRRQQQNAVDFLADLLLGRPVTLIPAKTGR